MNLGRNCLSILNMKGKIEMGLKLLKSSGSAPVIAAVLSDGGIKLEERDK